ncbi:hypothetical protein AAKU52_002487 [Pedobacter sp. CG_S7]|uniref:DUF6266 family protein n=1 Tax=Pedobacter sp. CG_S7 TaxID=3143930 RepID=UPI003396593E
MGKAKDGVFGGVTGKVGNLVGYYLNGQYILRSAPGKRRRKGKLGEKENRKKFGIAQAWLKPICFFVRVGFKNYGSSTGGYKAAVSYTLLNAIAGEYPNQYVDPELVQVSGGDLEFPEQVSMELEAENVLRFQWSPASENGDDYDQAMLLAYDEKGKNIVGKETAAIRIAGTDFLSLNPDVNGATYHIYMGFVAQDRSRQSKSIYLGKIIIPAI